MDSDSNDGNLKRLKRRYEFVLDAAFGQLEGLVEGLTEDELETWALQTVSRSK